MNQKDYSPYFVLLVAFVFMFFMLPSVLVFASQLQERDVVIAKQLDCFSANYQNDTNFDWADVCYTATPKPRGAEREEAIAAELDKVSGRMPGGEVEKIEEPFEYIEEFIVEEESFPVTKTYPVRKDALKNEESYSEESFYDSQKRRHVFELSTELYDYNYSETIGVEIHGTKGGMTGGYQLRLSENEKIESWDDFALEKTRINLFRLEGRLSYGKVDYDGSGTWGGIPDLNFETRGLVGIEFPFAGDLVIIPYSGFAYRYLYNDMSKYPAGFVDGQLYYSGYDRESTYLYVPLGMEVSKRFTQKWSLSVKNEFDWFIWGQQVSHLEDVVDINNVNPGFDKLQNTQENGYGWRISMRLTHEGDRFDIFVEPFVRYWHIEDSEFEFITAGGAYLCNGNLCSGGIEPHNKTWERGIALGAKF